MTSRSGSGLAKLLYATLFCGALPALLLAWARATADIVRLPAVTSLPLGLLACGLGLWLLAAGMQALLVHGGGLPMNLAPPPRYVTRGVYALTPHPIYVGFCLVCIGVALLTGSASGLWLVSPTMMLACTALVLGYEGPELRARFGDAVVRASVRLPADEPSAPSAGERAAGYLLVLLPWLALYEAVLVLGTPPDAISAQLAFEVHWPVWSWTELPYASTYPAVIAVPLLARTRRDLRHFMLRGLLAMLVAFPLYLALPLISPPRPFAADGVLGMLLGIERTLDGAGASFPAFHVIWAWLAADALCARWPRAALGIRAWALLVAVSCVTTGMHALLDVLGALVVLLAVVNAAALWDAIRTLAERIAGSWREWDLGPVRIINHGGWAAAGTLCAITLASCLAGGALAPILVAAGAGLVGAALWAQLIEGSPRLLRPYGFYGGMLGVTLGAFAAPLFGADVWTVLAAFCVAAPFVQSFGRLRCLVQGCCHGAPCAAWLGIRYRHPRSRVCRLSDFGGLPIHPTPVYSIAWNVPIALCSCRLWSLHAPLHLIGGVYLILCGVGRFVEEAYRGEPQTPVFAKLRAYQWVALCTVLLGALLTAVGRSTPAPTAIWNPASLVAAFGFSALTWFALGVDFPRGKMRFSRLV